MRVLVGFVIAFAAGCPAHVILDAPPPADAPEAMRASYYQSHRPQKARRENFQVRSRVGSAAPAIALKTLTLKNGVTINHVEDLQVMVSDESPTSKAIAEAIDARERANIITGVGVGVGAVGIGAGSALLLADVFTSAPPSEDNASTLPTLVLIGGGALATGVVVGAGLAVWGTMTRDVEDDATTRAFRSFDGDLRIRLALPHSEESPAGG
jgi:hypothetical protein